MAAGYTDNRRAGADEWEMCDELRGAVYETTSGESTFEVDKRGCRR